MRRSRAKRCILRLQRKKKHTVKKEDDFEPRTKFLFLAFLCYTEEKYGKGVEIMFNEYMWQTYLKAGGKEVADAFEKFYTNNGFGEAYADFITNLHKEYCPSQFVLDNENNQLLDLFNDLNDGLCFLNDGEYTIVSAMEELYQWISDNNTLSPQKVFDYFSGSVAYYTTYLSLEIPELFVPYYFTWNYNVYEKIAQEFEIELFPIPLKKEYEDRFYYYGLICATLLDFRKKHNMTPYELHAFLYDFAPKYIGGIDSYIIKDLPEPKVHFSLAAQRMIYSYRTMLRQFPLGSAIRKPALAI